MRKHFRHLRFLVHINDLQEIAIKKKNIYITNNNGPIFLELLFIIV